jgi:hypothetical protein
MRWGRRGERQEEGFRESQNQRVKAISSIVAYAYNPSTQEAGAGG